MTAIIILRDLLTKCQTIIIFIMNSSDKLKVLIILLQTQPVIAPITLGIEAKTWT
jgi:hypothetical protein